MRKVIFSLIALVVLALAAAFIGPSFVDWNKYKPEIAAQVKAATGRDITIAGDIGLNVLPAPTLSVHNVTVANLPGAIEPNMASLKALDVRVALGPLLEKRIKIESLTLIEPVITLEVLPDGRRNFDLAVPQGTAGTTPNPVAPAPAAPQAKPESGGASIEVENFRITDGTLTYRDDKKGTAERIEKLNADISLESLTGPVSAHGDLVTHGIKAIFEADAGRFEGGKIPLKLDLSLPDADAKAKFTGSLSEPTADGQVTGNVEAGGSSLARLIALAAKAGGASSPALPPPLGQKFSVAASVTGSAKAVTLKDLKAALGDTLASGSIAATPGTPLRADVAVNMTSLEIDPWLPTTAPESKGDNKAADKGTGAAKPAAAAAEGFSLPKDLVATFDLSIDAAVYKKDLIRQVKLKASLEDGKLSIKQASAMLPGGSSASATGVVASDGGKPVFDGAVEALSDNLRGVFDWLKVDVSSVPAERLRKFSLRSKIKGTPEQIDVTGLDVKLDTSALTGGVTVALRERPAFGARFDLDRFDLDAYLPQTAAANGAVPADASPKPEAKAPPGPAASFGAAPPALAVLKSFDANVQAKIGSLTVHGLQVADIALDGTLQNGTLTIRDASAADFGGGSAKLSGVLTGLGDKPAVDAAFDVKVKDPPRLMRLANREPPPLLAKLGAVGLSGKAKGALDNFSFDAALDAAGGRVSAQGTAGMPDTGVRYDAAIDAKHDDLPALVRLFNPDYHPAGQNLGGLSLAFHAKGDATAGELSDLKGKAGPVSFQGSGKARFDGPRPVIEANLQAGEIVTDLFLPPKPGAAAGKSPGGAAGGAASAAPAQGAHWSKEPFDFSPLRVADAEVKLGAVAITYGKYKVDKPELGLSLKNGVLDVHDLKGSMFQGAFDLKGTLDASAVPRLSGDVSVSKANIHEALFTAGNIDVAQGLLDFGMKVAGAGVSPFDLVSSLGGNGSMQVTDGVAQGFDLKAVSDGMKNLNSAVDFLKFIGTSMSGGQTKFTKLTGTFTIDKGVVRTNDVDMQADGGAGKGVGTIDLPGWQVDMTATFTLTDQPKVPSFGMRVVGPLDAPERKFETRDLEAYLVQKGVGTLLKGVLPGKEGQPAPAITGVAPLDSLLQKALPGQQAPAQPQAAPAPAAPQAAPAQQPQSPANILLNKALKKNKAPPPAANQPPAGAATGTAQPLSAPPVPPAGAAIQSVPPPSGPASQPAQTGTGAAIQSVPPPAGQSPPTQTGTGTATQSGSPPSGQTPPAQTGTGAAIQSGPPQSGPASQPAQTGTGAPAKKGKAAKQPVATQPAPGQSQTGTPAQTGQPQAAPPGAGQPAGPAPQ